MALMTKEEMQKNLRVYGLTIVDLCEEISKETEGNVKPKHIENSLLTSDYLDNRLTVILRQHFRIKELEQKNYKIHKCFKEFGSTIGLVL